MSSSREMKTETAPPEPAPSPTTAVQVAGVTFGGGAPFALIAGPCVVESRDHAFEHATALKRICADTGVPLVFKSSYDKANRTSIQSFRGVGVDEGLEILDAIRRELDVPVLTDVHTESQARAAGEPVSSASIRSRTTITSSARVGFPGNPSRVEIGPSFTTPPLTRSQSSAWTMIGTSTSREYSSTRRITLLSWIVLPSSLKATAPAATSADISVMASPLRPIVAAAMG